MIVTSHLNTAHGVSVAELLLEPVTDAKLKSLL